MKRYIVVLATLLCAWSWAEVRSMTCQVYGCSNDTVSLRMDSSTYLFEFNENALSDYPLNYDLTVALAEAKLIGPEDRVDHLSVRMSTKDCAEARGKIGDITCKGIVDGASVRVRRNEKHHSIETERRIIFTWDTLFSSVENPWGFELRMLPGSNGSESEWAIVLTINGKAHQLYPFIVNQCRYSF